MSMKTIIKYLTFVLLSFVLLIALFLYHVESIWTFNPEIDTAFTPNFNKDKYQQVKVGMTKDEVLSLLGEPFESHLYASSTHNHCLDDGFRPLPSSTDIFSSTEINLSLPPVDAPLEDTLTYSKDGACTWFDFAWLEYRVVLVNGSVVRKDKCWHGD